MASSLLGTFSDTLYGLVGSIIFGLAHGFVSPGLFIIVGAILYDRCGSRIINYYRGLSNLLPFFALLFLLFVFGNMGVPLTGNFIGEFLSLLGAFQQNIFIASIGATSVILSAVYSIFMYNRVTGGSLSPFVHTIPDIFRKEFYIILPLLVLTLILGIYPCFISYDVEYGLSNYLLFTTFPALLSDKDNNHIKNTGSVSDDHEKFNSSGDEKNESDNQKKSDSSDEKNKESDGQSNKSDEKNKESDGQSNKSDEKNNGSDNGNNEPGNNNNGPNEESDSDSPNRGYHSGNEGDDELSGDESDSDKSSTRDSVFDSEPENETPPSEIESSIGSNEAAYGSDENPVVSDDSDNPDNPNNPHYSDNPTKSDKSDESDNPNNPDNPDNPDKSDKSDKSDNPDNPDNPDKSDKSNDSDKSNNGDQPNSDNHNEDYNPNDSGNDGYSPRNSDNEGNNHNSQNERNNRNVNDNSNSSSDVSDDLSDDHSSGSDTQPSDTEGGTRPVHPNHNDGEPGQNFPPNIVPPNTPETGIVAPPILNIPTDIEIRIIDSDSESADSESGRNDNKNKNNKEEKIADSKSDDVKSDKYQGNSKDGDGNDKIYKNDSYDDNNSVTKGQQVNQMSGKDE
jgi:hypothetical protein